MIAFIDFPLSKFLFWLYHIIIDITCDYSEIPPQFQEMQCTLVLLSVRMQCIQYNIDITE